nr:hypothetical protein [Tanacetum cinerariifolium]
MKSPIAIAPVLPTKDPQNSLIMEDEHLSTIPEIESNKVIKSSVENLVPIPSKSEGILDNMCDEFVSELVHIDPIPPGIDETNSDPKDDIRFIEQLLYNDTSSEDDSFKDIDYVKASPPDSELVSLEEVKDKILCAKLLNIHILIDKIESDHREETSSGSTTTHTNNSLPEYDLFLFEIEPDQGELSSVAMEAILGETRVYVPNVLPTHPTFYQDSDFSSSDDSLGSGLEVSFPSGTRNKIFDPGIFIEVQSKRLLSWEEFSILLIHDPLCPVFDTLLPFSSKNEDKVFKPGNLSYLLVSHRDKTTFDFFKNPMMMYGGDIPLLDVMYLHFYPP